MTVENLLNRLERVRSNGKGRWSARCPSHADNGPSLSIREADDGRVLVHCFAGCPVGDVVAAVGLGLGDLFPEDLQARKAVGQRMAAVDVLDTAVHEVTVARAIVADLLKGIRPDQNRLALCEEKLRNCLRGLRAR